MHWSRPVLVVGIAVVATAAAAVLLRPWADEGPRPAAPESTSERAGGLTTLVARTEDRVARVHQRLAGLGGPRHGARPVRARVSAEALPYADRALALGTRDARAHFHRGTIRAAMGDKAGARADLTEALRINPRFAPRDVVRRARHARGARRVIRRVVAALGAVACAVLASAVLGPPNPAQAHPLGNFTTNQYAGLRVTPDAVDVDYVLDLAELPAFRRRDEVDTDASGKVSPVEGTVYAERTCDTVAGLTSVGVDGRPVPVVAKAAGFRQVPGAGGLATIRVECALRVVVTMFDAQSAVDFRVDAFADRTGWREITAVGDQDDVRALVGARGHLQRAPARLPAGARAAGRPHRPVGRAARQPGRGTGAPASPPRPTAPTSSTAWFGDLIGRPHLGLGIGLLALFLAIVLGAAHAVAPGHGKTVMAAYLISQRGNRRQALWMAGTVVATHTLGVLMLAVAIATSLQVAPAAAYGLLKLASGVVVAILGAFLLRRALHGHPHGHRHPHGHDHPHGHHHDHDRDHHGGAVALGSRTAVVMGFVGGLSPSPSAVVVLLGAAALGRAWFGVLLVLAYGVGMAATLTGVGLALARRGGAPPGPPQRPLGGARGPAPAHRRRRRDPARRARGGGGGAGRPRSETVRREEPDLFDDEMGRQVREMLTDAVECEVQFAGGPSRRRRLRVVPGRHARLPAARRRPPARPAGPPAGLRVGEPVRVHGVAGRAGVVELLRAPRLGLPGRRGRDGELRRRLRARPVRANRSFGVPLLI